MTHIKTYFKLLSSSLIVMISLTLFAQQEVPEKIQQHHEVPDSKSVHVVQTDVKTSPAYKHRGSNYFFTQVNIDEFGQNIINDAANEPSIAIDPTNPNRIMIGWRQFDDISSNFRQAGYAYSLDAGQTWTFPGVIDAGVFRSDPVLGCDPQGNFYYNSLTVTGNDEFFCDVYKTSDGGVEWDGGTFAHGGDKQWMIIDPTDGTGSGFNYSFWTKYYSFCYPDFFTRSTDLGANYEPCVSVIHEPYWGTLAVGPEGELYIAGVGEIDDIMLTKSTTAQIPGADIEWSEYSAVDLGGYAMGWSPVNPGGLMGQIYVDVDMSDGPGRGYVYVCASVVRPGLDAADVMIARSTDGGVSFDAPVRVNDDLTNTNYNWFGTMSVAPNGRIDVVWLDTRVDPDGGVLSALFYSYSMDQGSTWAINKQLSDMFDPHVGWPQQEKMGDYYHMVSDEGGAHLAWASTLNGEQDVYYAYIEPEAVGINDLTEESSNISVSNYPNPFVDKTTIRYSLNTEQIVRLAIYDIFGKEVSVVLNEVQTPGIHTIQYSNAELPAGIYICKMTAGKYVKSARMVKQ